MRGARTYFYSHFVILFCRFLLKIILRKFDQNSSKPRFTIISKLDFFRQNIGANKKFLLKSTNNIWLTAFVVKCTAV